MQAQAATVITPEGGAREVMETVPVVMHVIRTEMRSHKAPVWSVPQCRVLTFRSHRPGAPLSSVAEPMGVARSTASAMVDRLVRRPLVSRMTHPEARRRLVLRLTPAGGQHLPQARQAASARMATVLAGLPAADLRQVAHGLARLGRAVQAITVPRRR